MRKKLPYIQLYTGDWLKDPGLILASYAAKGLWVDLMCHMNESYERGYLVNRRGRPYTEEQIAILLGKPLSVVKPLLDELEDLDVYSKDERGAIFSRRLVRDEEVRKQKEQFGALGGRPVGRPRKAKTEESADTLSASQVNNTQNNNHDGYEEKYPGSDNDIDNNLITTKTVEQEGGSVETISSVSSAAPPLDVPSLTPFRLAPLAVFPSGSLPARPKANPPSPDSDSIAREQCWRAFVAEYPNQTNLEDGARAFLSVWGRPDGIRDEAYFRAEVLPGLHRYKKSEKWAQEDGKYIPAIATFLVGNGKTYGRLWRDHPRESSEFRQMKRTDKRNSEGVDPYVEWVNPWKQERGAA